MFQIDDPTAVPIKPAAPAAGPPGWFQGGDPATNTPGTRVRFAWLNMVQAEMGAILAKVGLAQDKTDDGQVLQALQRQFRGQHVQAFGFSTVWQVPDGVYLVLVRLWAGGGGGGGSYGPGSGGAGGSGGGYAEGVVRVVPGTSKVITVSTGGGGGVTTASYPGNGGFGQTTSFGTDIAATGGGGGPGANGALQSSGSVGGYGSGGHLQITGNPCGTPIQAAGGSFISGTGGGTFCIANTPFSNAASASPGLNGQFPGGGGSGGLCGGPGGNGASGLVIVEY